MDVRYFVGAELLTEIVEETEPERGTEICIDGTYFKVAQVVRHRTMCPPWHTNVHLVVSADSPDQAMRLDREVGGAGGA